MATRMMRPSDRSLQISGIIVGALAGMTFLIASGRLTLVAGALALALFAFVTYRQPLFAIFALIVLSTNLLEFVDPAHQPFVQVASSIRFTFEDVLTLMLFGLGLIKVQHSRRGPVFLRPLLLLGGAVGFSLGMGLLVGSINADRVLNVMRQFSGYLAYVGFAMLLDGRRWPRSLAAMVFVLLIVSVAVQGFEVATGERLVGPYAGANKYFNSTATINVQGTSVPYLWNRAMPYALLALFLAVGQLSERKQTLRSLTLASLGALAFVFSFGRSWMVYIVLSLVALTMLLRRNRSHLLAGLLVGATLLALVLSNWTAFFGPSTFVVLPAWGGRMASLARFWEQSTFIGRLNIWTNMFKQFSQSPVWGYGPGGIEISPDVGMINTLAQYGILGWAATVYLLVTAFRRTLAAWRTLPAGSYEKAYAAGLLGLWICIAGGYAYNVDFFSYAYYNIMIGLALAMVDQLVLRTRALASVVDASAVAGIGSWTGSPVQQPTR